MGLLRSLLRGLAVSRARRGETVSGRVEPRLLEAARRAVEALQKISIPGYDVDIVSGGLVKRVRVSRDLQRIAVYIDYTGSDPGCNFCRFISRTAWRRILDDIREALHSQGYQEVIVVDAATGLPVEG